MSRVRVTWSLVLSGILLLANGNDRWSNLLMSLGVRLLLSLARECVRTLCSWVSVVLLNGVDPILLRSRPTTDLTCTIPVGRRMRLAMSRVVLFLLAVIGDLIRCLLGFIIMTRRLLSIDLLRYCRYGWVLFRVSSCGITGVCDESSGRGGVADHNRPMLKVEVWLAGVKGRGLPAAELTWVGEMAVVPGGRATMGVYSVMPIYD